MIKFNLLLNFWKMNMTITVLCNSSVDITDWYEEIISLSGRNALGFVSKFVKYSQMPRKHVHDMFNIHSFYDIQHELLHWVLEIIRKKNFGYYHNRSEALIATIQAKCVLIFTDCANADVCRGIRAVYTVANELCPYLEEYKDQSRDVHYLLEAMMYEKRWALRL